MAALMDTSSDCRMAALLVEDLVVQMAMKKAEWMDCEKAAMKGGH